MGKTLRKTLIGIAVALLVIGVVAAGGLFHARNSYTAALAIDTSRGIKQASYVPIGGIDQWIQIRGRDRDNPVLLWLNGGPGFSSIPQTLAYQPWEEHFTVAMWDQRGEGRSFAKSGKAVAPTMSIDRMAADGIEVAQYLRGRLNKDKIILLGHSWGSILGVRMAQMRPDLFSAYVGTGQVVDLGESLPVTYTRILDMARKTGQQQAVTELESAGPPPYADPVRYFAILKWANRLDPGGEPRAPLSWPGLWTMVQKDPSFIAGLNFSQDVMIEALAKAEVTSAGKDFAMPVLMIQGEGDLVTPTDMAKTYFDELTAPSKDFIVMKDAGHLALMQNRARFLEELRSRFK